MNTFGWVLILAAVVLARAVLRGRVMNIGEDLSDAFLALVRSDTAELQGVFARVGEGFTPEVGVTGTAVGGAAGNAAEAIAGKIGIAANAVKLGKAAKGYRWTATGPTYYDCSGLMWRACQAVGFKGPRFTTASIRGVKGFTVVGEAKNDDIVLWPMGGGYATGHMGVVTGPDTYYSARSVRSGIGYSPIASFRRTKPIYLRYTGGA